MGEPQTKQWGVLSCLIQLNDIMQLQRSEVIPNASGYVSQDEEVEVIRRSPVTVKNGEILDWFFRTRICFAIFNLSSSVPLLLPLNTEYTEYTEY